MAATTGELPAGRPSNALLALVLVLAGEVMLFTGLIGAYLVLRFGVATWPPAGLPRLPLALTAGNSAVLFLSAWTMWRSVRSARQGDGPRLRYALAVTAFLGLLFLVVQGSEWARLVSYGLTLQAGTYGATFFLLVGAHALHVLVAVGWLVLVLLGAWRGRYLAGRHEGVVLCGLYWYFVCALWAVLFVLVYLI